MEASAAVNPRDAKNVLVAWSVRDNLTLGPDVADTVAGIMVAETMDGGLTWHTTQMHDPGVPDSPGRFRFAFDERAAFAPDGTALVLFGGEVDRLWASEATQDDAARITLAASNDGGATWIYRHVSETQGPRYDFFGFAVSPEGHLYVATQERKTGGVWLWSSTDKGASWTGPTIVATSQAGPDGSSTLPALAAGPEGFVAIATINVKCSVCAGPELPLPGVDGEGVRVSHDGGATFGPLTKVAGYDQSTLDAPSMAIDVRTATPVLHHVLSTDQGDISDAISADGGATWTPTSLNATLGPTWWAMIATGPDGTVHTLVRHGGTAPWAIDWVARGPDGTISKLQLAHGNRAPRTSNSALPNATDDYGGLAPAPDGTVWAAFADPRGTDHSRIAVVHLARS